MRSVATIIIALVLLVPVCPQRSEVEPKQLAYNPTYEIWFFIPSGRPDNVPKNVQEAYYASQNSGGVCYLNEWYYCQSGQVIKV